MIGNIGCKLIEWKARVVRNYGYSMAETLKTAKNPHSQSQILSDSAIWFPKRPSLIEYLLMYKS